MRAALPSDRWHSDRGLDSGRSTGMACVPSLPQRQRTQADRGSRYDARRLPPAPGVIIAVEVLMRWSLPVAAALVAACGAASNNGGSTSPIISGDTCALHQDEAGCRADARMCLWYANTRPCQAGDPCPAGWCNSPQPLDGGAAPDGGASASAACACPGAMGATCLIQIGGPAIPVEPPITCATFPAGCVSADRCVCLAQGSVETCQSSDQVTNLCVCDNGVR
jgi:hypothetical protein